MLSHNKRKIMLLTMTVLSVATLALLGITYAYFGTRIVGNSSEQSISVTSNNLFIEYVEGDGTIRSYNISPGYTNTYSFSVKNTTSANASYGIVLDNVINEFSRTEDWTYVLYEVDSSGTRKKITEGNLPSSTTYILNSTTINANSIINYEIDIVYADLTGVDQSVDMGAKLSMRVNIGGETGGETDEKTSVTITVSNQSSAAASPSTHKIIHNGITYYDTATFTANVGDKIYCYAYNDGGLGGGSRIYLNNNLVGTYDADATRIYEYTVVSNATIEFSTSYTATANKYNIRITDESGGDVSGGETGGETDEKTSVTITVTVTGDTGLNYNKLIHNGTTYYQATTFTAYVGDTIQFYSYADGDYNAYIKLNGVIVGTLVSRERMYEYTVVSDASVVLDSTYNLMQGRENSIKISDANKS